MTAREVIAPREIMMINAAERGAKAFALHESGLTWEEVAAHFGVTRERARQMSNRWRLLSKMKETGLTDIRTRTVLIYFYLSENPNADQSTWVGGLPLGAKEFARSKQDWEWLHQPNFGKKTLKVLRNWSGPAHGAVH